MQQEYTWETIEAARKRTDRVNVGQPVEHNLECLQRQIDALAKLVNGKREAA